MNSGIEEQKFYNDLDTKLWTSADKLRNNLDAAVYKHVVLGLVFLKYVSDSFEDRRIELREEFKDSKHDMYIGDDTPDEVIEHELEDRDYYTAANVFWVPERARWENIIKYCRVGEGTELPWEEKDSKGILVKVKFKGTDDLIDKAMDAIEKDNPRLRGILNKEYRRVHLKDDALSELIDLINQIPFKHKTLKSKDILGHVYEYFLGKFALAEGQRGGQYFTPKSIVSLIVELIEPYKGKVYDPAMGSGGFFISSEKFIETHGGKINDISVYGQESNPTTWKLAAMNMVIHGIEFDFGKEPDSSFTNDQHKDLRADFVMANPPFNVKEWWSASLENDPRWEFGRPSEGNANFAWIQHMLFHLSQTGTMALLLANGSLSSNTGGEGEIRKELIKQNLVECIISLPGQLFTNTQIPACIWILTKNKKKKGLFRDRMDEFLFIDAKKKGFMADRVLKSFSVNDKKDITDVYHNWRKGKNYEDIAGLCKSIKIEDIEKNGWVLSPGRYVESEVIEDDGVSFEEKIKGLNLKLENYFFESNNLNEKILINMKDFIQ